MALLSCVAALGLFSGVAQAASTGSAGSATAPVTPYSWPAVLSETSTTPVTVTNGIAYNQMYYDTADGDAHAFVLNVDLTDPNVTLVPQLTTGVLASDGATLSSTIARTGAVAGVNGDYFDRVGYIAAPAGDGQPTHMLIQDGQTVASGVPDGCGIVGYTQQDTLVIGTESFSGTVTDGSAAEALSAINEVVWPDSTSQCSDKVGSPGLVLETPQWGARSELDEAAPIALLEDLGSATYQVLSITASATESPALTTGESALIGYGTSGTFVEGTLQVGQVISVADSITPDTGDLQDAFGGGYLAVINGQVNPQIAGNNTDIEAATVIGVTEDASHVIVGVFDGGDPGEEGIGYSQMAGWLLQEGAYEGIIMDNGGSSEMDARLPGDTEASVLNSPSDGHERLLAECVCFYSTETTAGPAVSVTLNGGNALRALAGTTVDVPEVATDAEGNPASGSATVTVSPASAATVIGTTTAAEGETEAVLQIGQTVPSATATITDGSVSSSIDLHVVSTNRIYGQTADATAAEELARQFTPTAGDCPASASVVLARDDYYSDALASQYLAASLATGTLLTATNTLSAPTSTAIEDEGIAHVYIVGGPRALSTAVVTAIKSLPAYDCGGKTRSGATVQVTRISGATEYATAQEVATTVGSGFLGHADVAGAYVGADSSGGNGMFNDTAGKGSVSPAPGTLRTAILATGASFQDAESASVISYAEHFPILLTTPTSLSPQAATAIKTLAIAQVIVMGGQDAISDGVTTELQDMGVSVLRVAGAVDTDTAVQAARFEMSSAGLAWTPASQVVVARGDFYSDGLAGAVVEAGAGRSDIHDPEPLLLTEDPTTVGPYLSNFLELAGTEGIDTSGTEVSSLTVLGGPLAVSTAAVGSMGDGLLA